jgi:hypothetical protein
MSAPINGGSELNLEFDAMGQEETSLQRSNFPSL